MKCPKCNTQMKKVKVKIQDANSPVISYQCSECGYFDFEKQSINKAISKIKLKEIYFAIQKYKDGKISIGKAAEIANLPISDMIDLFSNLGIKSKLEVIDYIEGKRNLKND